MAKLGQHRFSVNATTPTDGAGAPASKPAERYCALCGQHVDPGGTTTDRFGEAFCSDVHAQEFAKAVRTARVQIAAASPGTTEIARAESSAEGASKAQSWKGLLKMGLCCGLPILALVVLAGGGGAVLGAAGALLPALAVLACPLGMYFMMRGMSKAGDHGNAKDKGGDR